MRFSVDRAPLLAALQKAHTVIDRKTPIAVLNNLLFAVRSGVLWISATDLEVGIRLQLAVEMDTEGEVTLGAKHVLDIVKEFPDKKIRFNLKENSWVEITCGKSKFNLVGMATDQYPKLPNFEEKAYAPARSHVLKNMIDRTQFASSADSARYHLHGVYLESLEGPMIRMVATDGHRLSFVDDDVFTVENPFKLGIIIPKKGLSELRRFIDRDVETVGLCVERDYIFVQVSDAHLFIKLIEGDYPDYRPVLPKALDNAFQVNSLDFISAVKRVSLLSNEKSSGIKFVLNSNCLTIYSSNPDMGEAFEELDVQYGGQDLEIGFNSKYLLDDLHVVKSETLDFKIRDRLSPGLIQETGYDQHSYILMPMRLS